MVTDKPIIQVMTTGEFAEYAQGEPRTAEAEPERIKVKVGTLEIETVGHPFGATIAAATRILIDGKPAPFKITGLRLILAMDDVVRVEFDAIP